MRLLVHSKADAGVNGIMESNNGHTVYRPRLLERREAFGLLRARGGEISSTTIVTAVFVVLMVSVLLLMSSRRLASIEKPRGVAAAVELMRRSVRLTAVSAVIFRFVHKHDSYRRLGLFFPRHAMFADLVRYGVVFTALYVYLCVCVCLCARHSV